MGIGKYEKLISCPLLEVVTGEQYSYVSRHACRKLDLSLCMLKQCVGMYTLLSAHQCECLGKKEKKREGQLGTVQFLSLSMEP